MSISTTAFNINNNHQKRLLIIKS